MRILARRGNSQFLVTDSLDESDINPSSKLVDLRQNLATPMPAQQAIKWGYWELPGDIPEVTVKQIEALANSSTRLQQVANLLKIG